MTDESPPQPRPEPTDAEKETARRWFEHGRKAADTKNYDYAIDLYLRGLEIWPEAVEEALKPLRVVGTARRMSGKKAPGFLEVRKYPTNGRDARRNLANALHLFALDPGNPAWLEAILINAVAAGCPLVAHWAAPILWDALAGEKKVSPQRSAAIVRALERAGDAFEQRGDLKAASETYRVAQLVADRWRSAFPDSSDASKAVSDSSSKLTIVNGRFGTADDYRESLKDAAGQRDLHDRQRVVQHADRARELIDKARAEYERDAEATAKLLHLVDLLTRTENEEDENEAVRLLTEAHQRREQYALKVRADDLRMRQLRRATREAVAAARAAPADAALPKRVQEALDRQLEAELQVYEERCAHYPTDMRFRYELGIRFFEARRYDDAIPRLQQAQGEPRRRNHARLYIGRCFFEKRFYPQAIDTLAAAATEHPIPHDDLGKDLRYWLGRAREAAGQTSEAAADYGRLIQIDYNHRDARQRLERLSAAEPQEPTHS